MHIPLRPLALAGLLLGLCPAVHAQGADAYPTRPVRILVAFPPGGPIDLTARIMGEKLSEYWKHPVVVENRPGASGVIAAEAAMQAPADGYTLLFSVIHHTVLPSLKSKLPYDIEKDFTHISLAATYPIILVVGLSRPYRSVKDLIDAAARQPGELAYGHSGYGGGAHLAGELFGMQAGVDLRNVPYKGNGPALADVIGGHIPLMFSDAPTALPQVTAGKVRALAISTPRRSELLPDVPTFVEAGLPDYKPDSWGGVSVRAGTPQPVVDKLNADVVRALKDSGVRARLLKIGAEPQPMSAIRYTEMIHTEIAKWGEVVRKANIQIE
ncbi:Tripartite tricarboxylate transporter family receptor [Pigmentiphaga humi]|uniref:Tripartite tricarboxylate transporter family receptor n=1 Tax=Pigmentiphaga humi TaxID=2478468 RepID=A0A3P4B2E8_9BURK|nr:tripartite tricarboxylate transporter substrate binding protein [Pigmentiphaga humi]VCU70459.1 Tripartite tricarboxylate transporter family receptor [Pigmentiphaga humi]